MYDVCLHASSRVRVSDLHAPHKVYEERANQKPLTREDGLHAKRLLLSKMLSKDFLIDIYICSTISCCQINYH